MLTTIPDFAIVAGNYVPFLCMLFISAVLL